MKKWDDKTDEIVLQTIDTLKPGEFFQIEENRNLERFRVKWFVNGVQVGSPMYAFDLTGVFAIIRLLYGERNTAA